MKQNPTGGSQKRGDPEVRRDHGGLLGEDVPGRARGTAFICAETFPPHLSIVKSADGVHELHELPQQDALGVGALAPGFSRARSDLYTQDPEFRALWPQHP